MAFTDFVGNVHKPSSPLTVKRYLKCELVLHTARIIGIAPVQHSQSDQSEGQTGL